MPDIEHKASIIAFAETVYPFLTTKDGLQQWLRQEDGWTITGGGNVGDTLRFQFKDAFHEMKIIELVSNKRVKWECTTGHPEWMGTTVDFSIDPKEYGSDLAFGHRGWHEKTAFFDMCNEVWKGNVNDIKRLAEGNTNPQ